MPKIAYMQKNISDDRLVVIAQANKILDAYEEQGFDLTLRQLYYQFVAHDMFPDDRRWRQVGNNRWGHDPNGTKNADPNYKWLGDIVSDGRMCGLIDWERIEDRTRNLKRQSAWTSPAGMIESAFRSYHRDRWEGQPCRVELWCEKEALIGIFARVCEEWDVPYFACRGYVSISEAWRAAQRLIRYRREGQVPVILHFGDHDPSGVDMTRDIRDRLATFGVKMDLRRLALNMDQVEQYNPPPNPAKLTDARAKGYIAEYGDESWELDALDPATLTGLAKDAVHKFLDVGKWKTTIAQEVVERSELRTLQKGWEKVSGFMRKKFDAQLVETRREVSELDEYEVELEALDGTKGVKKEKLQIFENDEPDDDDFEDCESCGASTLIVELARNEKKTGYRVCDPCAEDENGG